MNCDGEGDGWKLIKSSRVLRLEEGLGVGRGKMPVIAAWWGWVLVED